MIRNDVEFLTLLQKHEGIVLSEMKSDYLEVLVLPDFYFSICEWLKEDAHYNCLVDLFASIDDLNKSNIYINLLLRNYDFGEKILIRVKLLNGETLISLKRIWIIAEKYEIEISEKYLVNFDHKDKNLFFVNESLPDHYDIPERFNIMSFQQDFGLNNSKLDMNFYLEGSIIKDLSLDLGFHHRGLEYHLEKLPIRHSMNIFSQIDLDYTNTYQILWLLSIESTFGLDIADRTKAIRMLILEFERIKAHLICFVKMAYASYFQDIYHQAQIALQRIVFHLKNFSGQNGVNTFHTIGGLSSDISNEWITDSLELLKFLDDDYLPFNYLALKSGFWSNKLKQKGIIHNVIALDFSLSGPNARALGINYDIRKNHPYYFYKDVTFEVPLGVNGDTLDRFLIRLEEISQSTSIIAQVLENLPTDKVNEKINDMVTKEEYLNNILSIKSAMTTKDFNYSSIEGVNGELGLSLFTTANGINRAKLKTGDFGAVMALNQILAEISIENASLVISSLNLSIQGVER